MPRKDVRRQAKIDAYFAENPVPTVSGLALALGMTREELAGHDGRDGRLQRAMQRIQAYLEERAYGRHGAGCALGLRNNFGWDCGKAAKPGKPGRVKAGDDLAMSLAAEDANGRAIIARVKRSPAWRAWRKVKVEVGAGSR